MNEASIRYTLDLMKPPNEVIEVRTVGQKTYSGYFRNIDNLIREIKPFQKDNIYFVLNEISEECYDREQQERMMLSKHTTSDNDIRARRWLLIDIDSKRASGVGATDEEKELSKKVGHKVYSFLRDIGFSSPISADSGNGYHLLYPIKLAPTPENAELIRNVLKVLDMYFSTDDAVVDTTVFNASRITKLYGTIARKGRDSTQRPHRESKIVKAPDEIKPTDISLLRKVADMLPKPEGRSRFNNYGTEQFSLDEFISKHGIKTSSVERYTGGTKYVLEQCLFDPNHKGKDAAIFQLDNGAIGYKCFHNSCSGHKWQDVRMMFEPNAYDRPTQRHEAFNTAPSVVKKQPQVETESKGEKFLQLSEIADPDKSKLVYMQSHIEELDKKIIGFLKGEVSMWSGANSSGKSTVLGQLCLNAINDGFKALMYSGELVPHRVKNWIQLQAAGRQFTKPTQYENLYYVPKNTSRLIDSWLNDKFFLYNNDYGNEYTQLIADLSERLEKGDIDMVVLDNLMTFDIDELASDENSRQTKVIKNISKLAKKYNVHIHIVAHPKKTTGFLRKNDISGSLNLSNIVDNVFIVHRVNNDFIRNTNEYFGNGEAVWMHTYSNIIETCKNRDIGVQDYFVGTYFERESKRFLNEKFGNFVYGWQELDSNVATYTMPDPVPTIEFKTSEFNDDLPFHPIDKLPF